MQRLDVARDGAAGVADVELHHLVAGDALRSALAQRLDDLEIIVIDDGSTDDTVAVIRKFGDPRIRLFARSHLGLVSAINAALAPVRDEFIAFLDGDDVWYPEKLVRHVSSSKNIRT